MGLHATIFSLNSSGCNIWCLWVTASGKRILTKRRDRVQMNTAICVAVEGTTLYELLAVTGTSCTGISEGCQKDEFLLYTPMGRLATSFIAEIETKLSNIVSILKLKFPAFETHRCISCYLRTPDKRSLSMI
jgi:hypothetical protein